MRKRIRDVGSAVRGFARAPGFSVIAVLTLAIGIGSTTLIFSVVNGVLIKPLPYPDSDQLVGLTHEAPGLGIEDELVMARGLYYHYGERGHTLESMALWDNATLNVAGDGDPEQISAIRATHTLFPVLQVAPALGRTFTEAEDLLGASPVAVLSHGFWSRRYGSDPAMVGRTLELDGITHEVVGVMSAGFAFPDESVSVWVPLQPDTNSESFGGFNKRGIARLNPNVTPETARADLQGVLPSIVGRYVELTPELVEQAQLRVNVRRLKEDVVGDTGAILWVLLGTVGFVLLIACGNVANLLLVRAEARQKEVAIRMAMGAGRSDLAWSFLTESVTLALLGGALGTALAFGGMQVLHSLGPSSLPRLSELNVDAVALAFAGGVSILSGLLFGLIPVLRYGIPRAGAVLQDGSRGSTGGRERHTIRSALVVAQTAFALMLLVGSGLMVRTFHELTKVDPGFDGENVLTLRLATPASEYETTEQRASFYHQVLDRLAALPGVESVGAGSQLPLTGWGSWDPLSIEDQPPEAAGEIPPIAPLAVVDPGYFETLRIPLLTGRMLERRDAEARTGAVLVSRSLVDEFFEGEDPIGKRLAHGMPDEVTWSTVVGVVGDVYQE